MRALVALGIEVLGSAAEIDFARSFHITGDPSVTVDEYQGLVA
jgi:hypothetical protein